MNKKDLMQKVMNHLELDPFWKHAELSIDTGLIEIEDLDGKKYKLVAVEVNE